MTSEEIRRLREELELVQSQLRALSARVQQLAEREARVEGTLSVMSTQFRAHPETALLSRG